jgi:uncharacterized membrane protein
LLEKQYEGVPARTNPALQESVKERIAQMSLAPVIEAGLIIQLHILAATIALVVGPFALWRKRRDKVHKMLGYTWVTSMGLAALISFAIPSEFSPIGFGPIHLLSIYALYGLWVAMRAIYRRDIALHKLVMENVYVRGLALAGAFNFLPGRTTARSLIPETPEIGYVIIAAVLVWALTPLVLRKRAQQPS